MRHATPIALTALALLAGTAHAAVAPTGPAEDAAEAADLGPAAVDITFPSAAEGVTLAGTVLLPSGDGPFPGVILVSTEGAQTRDGISFGKPVLKTLAERLARAGIATLRYDDRGVGGSTGSFPDATLDDFALDARGAFDALAARPEVKRFLVGAVGHGEGGLAAIKMASTGAMRGPLALLNVSAIDGAETLAIQQATSLREGGVGEAQIAIVVEKQRAVVAASLAEDDQALADAVADLVAEHYRTLFRRDPPPEVMRQNIPEGIAQASHPKVRSFAAFDPAEALREARRPVLAVYGGLDSRVSAEANIAPMASALRDIGDPASRIVLLPLKNHLMQTARAARAVGYEQLGDAPAPDVLEIVADWLSVRLLDADERARRAAE